MALDDGAIAAIVILTLIAVALIITLIVLQTRPATVCETCGTNGVNIAVVNQSSASGTDVTNFVAAVQIQVSNDLFKAWGLSATLIIYPNQAAVPAKMWYILLQDTTDLAGSVGYHSVDTNGIPFAKVFVQTAAQAGIEWSITLSHETLEMLGDPFTGASVFKQDSSTTGVIVINEIADPCEADVYSINGVQVSDFVFPAWFFTFLPGPYDQLGLMTQPYEIRNQGFATTFSVTNGSGYNQVNGPAVITMNQTNLASSSTFIPKDGTTRLLIEKQKKLSQ